jgi:hypothetical protein
MNTYKSSHQFIQAIIEKYGVDNTENRLKETLFVVEATSTEHYFLWERHCKQSLNPYPNTVDSWVQINSGEIVTVGNLDNRPCNFATQWAIINGFIVMFYYDCSQVTDSLKTEKWIEKHFDGKWDKGTRRATCDAMNFHLCLNAIDNLINTKV